jgi:hypothetical protein
LGWNIVHLCGSSCEDKWTGVEWRGFGWEAPSIADGPERPLANQTGV